MSYFKLIVEFLSAGLRSGSREIVLRTAKLFERLVKSKAVQSGDHWIRILSYESLLTTNEMKFKSTFDHILPVC